MLDVFESRFNDVMNNKTGHEKDVLLASIMTDMERFYCLSMVREIFEKETTSEIRMLYLSVSNARSL